MKRWSNWKLALVISTIYTLLGTAYSYYAIDQMVTSGFLYWFFFPVSIVPQLILFTEREPFYSILLVQTITTFALAALIWVFLKSARDE